jgi:predicted ferric reductase
VASAIIVIVATAVGEVVSTVRSSMLPWVFGRGLGLASFAALAALSVVGLWRRHPLRETWPLLKPASLAKVHTVLASATMALLAGHVIAIVVDSYARVGLIGALVPMQSAYQPWPVTLGTISLWLLLAIWATARMSKSIAKRSWKAVHRASMFTFGCVWLHGLTIGTDTPTLRPAYISIGAVIVTVWLSSAALQTLALAKKRSSRP